MSVRRERDTRDVLTQKKKKKPCRGYRGEAAINAPRRPGLGRIQTCRRFIWTYSLQNPEKINSCCFRHPACNTALRQPPGNTKHHLLRENTRAAAERQKGGTDCVAKVGHASKRGVSEKLIYKSG